MKILRMLISVAALAAVFTFPVHAADKGGPTVAEYLADTKPALSHRWTAFYVGAHAGYSWKTTDVDVGGVTLLSAATDDFIGGGHIGADYRFGNMLVGAMADYTMGSGGVLGGAYKVRDSWTVAARGGFLLTDTLLMYGLAGWTWANTSSALAGIPDIDGMTLGGGIEWAAFDRLSMRLEYRMTDYDKSTLFGPVKLDNVDHSVRFGLTYKLFSF